MGRAESMRPASESDLTASTLAALDACCTTATERASIWSCTAVCPGVPVKAAAQECENTHAAGRPRHECQTKGILSWVGHSWTIASQLTEDSISGMRDRYCLTGK